MSIITSIKVFFADKANITKMLIYDEALKNKVYKDSKGYWTIGIGHFIGKSLEQLAISNNIANAIFKEDLHSARKSLFKIFGKETIKKWTPARKHAVLNMIFNLGEPRFLEFHNTIKHIKNGDWVQASNAAKDSDWFTDVKSRGVRVCYQLETGEYHVDYKIS